MSSFVPAFIEVGIQFPFKLIVRIEQLEELQRQFVIYLPAIGRSVCPDIEVLRCVLSDDIDAVRLLRSELRAKASVGIDFKVEIIRCVCDLKEEFKAAVFPYGLKRFGVLGANIFFDRAEMNVERIVRIA